MQFEGWTTDVRLSAAGLVLITIALIIVGVRNVPKTGRPAQLVAGGILSYLDSWLAIFRSWGIHARPLRSRAPMTSSNNRYVSC
jgi:hypothetical protein